MLSIKKRMYTLFFAILLLLPLSVNSQTCAQLSCFSLGKTCVQTPSGTQCADYCKDKGLAVAPVGGCAADKRYCSAGNVLTSKCSVCGCAKGEICQADGSCAKVCNDGTLSSQCSVEKPLFCQNGKLVENSNACGCSEGKVPQQDGSCGFKSFMKDTTIWEFLYGKQSGVTERRNLKNLAPEGTAFASSVYDAPSSWWYKPTPNHVNDGTAYGADWISAVSSGTYQKNQYIGIEWSEEKTFNEIQIVQSQLHAKNYKIQYFKNGAWVDATKQKELEYFPKDFAQDNWNYDYERVLFEPVKSTKVRIFFPECWRTCRLYEMRVRNSDEDSLGLNTVNSLEGEFISRIIDTGTLKDNIKYENFYFTSHVEGSSSDGASVKLQVRTAGITKDGFKGKFTPWTGPDGTSGTFYETSGQAINPVVYKSTSIYASTGFLSPTATGEKFNTWTSPQNAFVNDGSYASKSPAQEQTNERVTSRREDPGRTGRVIEEISGEAFGRSKRSSSSTGSPTSSPICPVYVDVSWDGGNSYSTTKGWNFKKGEFTFGRNNDWWGRRWTALDFANNNFRVRIIHNDYQVSTQDYYNFNFPDLSGKTIRGIEIKITGQCAAASSLNTLNIDSIQANVHTYEETYDKSTPIDSHNGKKYIQYRALFSTNDKIKVPFLDDVKITYSGKFNSKPIVSAKDKEVVLGTPVNFAAFANDIDGKIISYEWDFGNGQTGDGSNPTYNYPNDGLYTVKVTAKDDDGAEATAKAKVSVNVYNCLSDSAPKSGPAANLFEPADPTIKLKATEALLEYAQSKGIKVNNIGTTLEYYEAANNYITKHTSYMPDTSGWDGVSAKKLFTQSGARGCGNKFCGDCEDFAITTESLLRAMGVSPKCAYVACSQTHCYNILNIGGRFRIIEPQVNSLTSEFNSKAYEWKNDQGNPNYASNNLFNDEVGRYAIVNDANPETYTLNYPDTSGLPNPSKKCPASYSQWKGQGDQTYFDDKCP